MFTFEHRRSACNGRGAAPEYPCSRLRPPPCVVIRIPGLPPSRPCGVSVEELQRWLDGEAGADTDRLAQHVKACPDCAAEVASWVKVADQLRQVLRTVVTPEAVGRAVAWSRRRSRSS